MAAPLNATQSPYTYEEMKRRQAALGPTGPLGPIAAPDTANTVDDAVLNAEAADSEQVAPIAPAVPVKPQTPPEENRAKRAVVLHALRNSEAGRSLFAKSLRAQYGLPHTSKLSDAEVIQSAFDVQSAGEPDLTPHDFESDLHSAYGEKVDRTLLKQAHEDYPGITDESKLIDRMYRAKLKSEELGPVTYEDMAQIVARRFPKLHASALPPDKALAEQYKLEKAKGKDIGSYQDWLHTMAAPTLFEKMMGASGAIAKGLVQQVKDVGMAGKLALTPTELQTTVAAALSGDEAAKQKLIEAGKGAVTVGSLAAGPLVGAGLGAAEAGLGVAKTAPLLAGALEGATVAGAQGAGEAAVEGKPLAEVAQSGLNAAGAGAPIGAIAGLMHGHVVHGQETEAAAKAASDLEAAKAAGSADLSDVGRTETAATVTDPMELAARHQAEQRWGSAVSTFAEKHGMDSADVHALADPDVPPVADLAAANLRHGVSIADINELKNLKPEHLAEPPVAPPVIAVPEAAAPSPVTAAAPAERGLVQSSVSDKMTEALKRASAQLEERRAMLRQQLSSRLGEGRAAFENAGGGMAGLRAKLTAMAGEMKKPDWNGVKDLFSDVDEGQLHTAIAQSNMLEGDKLSAHAGLARLLNPSGMGAPTASQIRALRAAFGSEFTDAAMQHRPEMNVWLKGLMKTLNTPRTIMTSFDLSAGMRQGYLMTSQPGYWRAWGDMVKAAGSEQFAKDAAQVIKDDHLYDVMRESGVYFQGPEFKAPSETFAGSWIDEAPGIKHSQQAYDTFINQTRANVFRDFYQTTAKNGVDVADPQFRRSLAHWVNTGTGRGNLAFLGRDANLLNSLAFSPRLAWSRFETFNPLYYASLHPTVRVAALAANGSTIGATMGLLGIIAGSGLAEVKWDPRSSDFAKIRVGNTRIDVLGGHQQLGRLFAQVISGKVISSTTGREIDLNGNNDKNGFTRGTMTRADILARFLEAKAAPLASLGLAILRGKDFLGRPISVENEVMTRLTPMPIQDIADAAKDGGWGRVALAAPAATIGLGVQTYSAQLPKAAGGAQQPDYGVGMDIQHWLWNRVNGEETHPTELAHVNAQLVEQWVKDAAMAQMIGHHEATLRPGFWDSGYDQQGEIRKSTARRMSRVNKLYKDLSGANGEGRRLAANQNLLQQRADATGVDAEALRNPSTETTKP